MMVFYHLLAVTLACLLDMLIGDPKNWPHPVRWVGAFIGFLDRRLNKGRCKIARGIVMTGMVLAIVFSISYVTVMAMYSLHPAAGVFWEAILISAAIARRSLKEAAMEVYHPLSNGDLSEARTKLSYIVGRDTDMLDVSEIVRGTVETVAENTSDGVTAPLFWGAIGGAPFAIAYRAINTCDSMVGYRNERYEQFGWASAQLDDLVNWVPSRLTAFAMLVSTKSQFNGFRDCWKITIRDAPKHPSPNSGWGEAATAAILGIQLGGVNYYKGSISDRARMGTPIVTLKPIHIQESIAIMLRASFSFLLLLWIGGIGIEMALSWI